MWLFQQQQQQICNYNSTDILYMKMKDLDDEPN